MFVNKWLVIDSFDDVRYKDWQGGFCLELDGEQDSYDAIFKHLGAIPPGSPFSILLSEKISSIQKISDLILEGIISLFFQPSYYLASDKPVIFLDEKMADKSELTERLSEKCRKQGLSVLILKAKNGAGAANPGQQFVYKVNDAEMNFEAIVENWLSLFKDEKNPGEMHFLFRKDEPRLNEILKEMEKRGIELRKTDHYRLANLVYQKQKLIDEYKRELDLKSSIEKSTELYLDLQKKQTADNVEWYHHEYEILPAWYKRFGHVIKVLMGKRTFRSLFDDKVKKYKK